MGYAIRKTIKHTREYSVPKISKSMCGSGNETIGGEKRPDLVLKKVTRVFRGETLEWLHLVLSNNEELKCTREHPFSVKGKGWIPACDLQPGDQFITAGGKECALIKSWVEHLDTPEITYNFEVEGCHNYFVGNSGILVHNMCPADAPNQRYIENKYCLKDGSFHTVKKEVLRQANIADDLLGTNPDIIIKPSGKISLTSRYPLSPYTIQTDLHIDDIIKALGTKIKK